MLKKKQFTNSLVKAHNKKSYKGVKFSLINYSYLSIIFYKLEHMTYKTKKWLFRRLAKQRLVLNYRALFLVLIKNNFKNKFNYQLYDPLKNFFFKFEMMSLISLDYYKLTDYHIELIRRLARKLFGKRIFINVLIAANFNILRRANQMRMGGGKGAKFSKKIYFIYPGCKVIEVRGILYKYVKLFYFILKKKMPFLFKIVLLNRI